MSALTANIVARGGGGDVRRHGRVAGGETREIRVRFVREGGGSASALNLEPEVDRYAGYSLVRQRVPSERLLGLKERHVPPVHLRSPQLPAVSAACWAGGSCGSAAAVALPTGSVRAGQEPGGVGRLRGLRYPSRPLRRAPYRHSCPEIYRGCAASCGLFRS
jgi:hypothetical protein